MSTVGDGGIRQGTVAACGAIGCLGDDAGNGKAGGGVDFIPGALAECFAFAVGKAEGDGDKPGASFQPAGA